MGGDLTGAVGGDGAGPVPRWSPDRPLAQRITRRGRFETIDPEQGRPLPGLVKWLAFGWWVSLVGGAIALAWRRERGADGARGGSGAAGYPEGPATPDRTDQ